LLFEIVALLCIGLFSGAAAYVTFVEHPARVSCGPALAVAEFGPSYRRGTVMQASLAAIGLATAILAWTARGDVMFLVAGVLLGSVIPFTLIVILPTNKRLLDSSLDPSSAEAAALLSSWGRLHAVRTTVGLVAFGLLVTAFARG
jgi:uncharacterized membrane protein